MGRENTTQPGFGTVAKPHDSERDSELPTGSRRVDASGYPQAPAVPPEAPAPDTPAPTAQRGHDTPVLQSGRKKKVQTQRGLTSSKPPKLVTKHGLAPPPPTSSPPPPPPDDPNWKPEPIPTASHLPKIDLSDDSGWVPDHAAIQAARDEMTPTAPEIADFEEDAAPEPDGVSRAQFRTNRGGGKNRLSGGRSAASAYVSPSTLAPGHGLGHHTAAVKIHSSVLVDSQRYHTEPSLLRRRQSTVPAAPPRRKRPHVAWILLLSLVGGFGSGLLVLAYHSAPSPASAPGTDSASESDRATQALQASSAQDEKSKNSRNAAPGSPKPLTERASDASTPSTASSPSGDAAPEPPSPPAAIPPAPQTTPSRPTSTSPGQPKPVAAPTPRPTTKTRPTQSKSLPTSPAPESTPTHRIVPQSDSSSDELWLE